jgi:dienelactone hydrolase
VATKVARRGALTILALAAVTLTTETMPAAQTSPVSVVSFAENGVRGRLFLPAGSGRHPAVIVMGGSEGGVEWSAPWGVPLAQRGFVVLALAYFGTDPLAARLQSIPLEYFTRAIESLQRHPRVDPDRLGLMGFSKGAEGALLIAAMHSSIRAVVATSPSHVARPGITGNPAMRLRHGP